MASPPIPPALLQLAARPFSFYPPVSGVQPNEWRLRKADWQELVVVNTRNAIEISIPRKYVGEISPVGDPFLIVGLLRELQYANGALRPLERRVIEMPIAVGERIAGPQPVRSSPAPVIGIRLEPRRSHHVYKISGAAIAAALLILTATANFLHPSYTVLTAADSYAVVIHKLGKPVSDRTSTQNGRTYRALFYRRFTAILSPNFIGAVDPNWKPLTPAPALSQLHRF